MDRSKWEYKKLGDICDKGSSNIAQNKIEDITGEYPLYGASGYVKGIDFYHQEKPYIGIVKDGSGVGRANLYPAKSSLLGTMQYIIPKDGCELGFLLYVLKGLHLEKYKTGAAIPHIYFKDYGKSIVPFPPLEDQQRIVAELDCLNEMIALKQEQLKEFDKLAQSIFYDMFGDIMLNDKTWPVYKWKELFDTKLGKMLDKKKQNDGDTPFPYLANVNVQWGYFDLNDLKTMTFNDREKEIFSLSKNDLLICEGGESGRCAIWMEETTDIKFQKAIHRARVKDKSLISPLYAMFYMKEIKGKGGLKNYVSKATIEHLTGEKLNLVPVLLPPLALQQQFAEKIQAIEEQKVLVKKSIAETQQLLDSRMDFYFD